jgi:hypothetical protein
MDNTDRLSAALAGRYRIEFPSTTASGSNVAPSTNDIFVMASGSRRHMLTLVQNWPDATSIGVTVSSRRSEPSRCLTR